MQIVFLGPRKHGPHGHHHHHQVCNESVPTYHSPPRGLNRKKNQPTPRILTPQKWRHFEDLNTPGKQVQTLPLEGPWGFLGYIYIYTFFTPFDLTFKKTKNPFLFSCRRTETRTDTENVFGSSPSRVSVSTTERSTQPTDLQRRTVGFVRWAPRRTLVPRLRPPRWVVITFKLGRLSGG